MRSLRWLCVTLCLVVACSAGEEDGGGGIDDFRPLTATDLVHKSFRFGPDAGIFEPDDARFGQSATLIVGEVLDGTSSAGFALTSEDGSVQGGTLTLGSCLFHTTFVGLVGREPDVGLVSSDFFYCGVDDEGRLGLLEDEEELPIISDPPTTPTPDLDTVVSLSPGALVDPMFDPATRPETGTATLELFGNVLSYAVSVEDLSLGDELRDARIHQGGASENGELVFTLFGSPIQPVRQVNPPFIEGTSITASIFLTPDEVGTLTGAGPIYLQLTSLQALEGLLRGQLGTIGVGPEGGVLTFPNGVVLDVPPGALSEAVDISVNDLPTEEVSAFLDARKYVLSKQRLLGGFLIEPHIVFNVPITGTMPVLKPEPYELLWRAEVDFEAGKVWPSETDLTYDAELGVAEVSIPHTSTVVTLGHSGSSSMPPWLAQSLEDLVCSIPEFNNSARCDALDALQPPCCLLAPNLPEGCFCCRQVDARFQSEAADYSQTRESGDCEIITDQVLALYPACEGAAAEQHIIGAVSPNCPEDMELDIEVEPRPVELFVCETKQLTSMIEGHRPDGTIVIPRQPWPSAWRSQFEQVARFDNPADGMLYGASVGFTRVFAQTGIAQKPVPAYAPVLVRSNVGSLPVDPPEADISVLDGRILSATVTKHDGTPLDASTISWFSLDDEIAYVTQDNGSFTSVEGVAVGCTYVVAEYVYDFCEIVKEKIPVCVDCRRIDFSVGPDPVRVAAGLTGRVTAEALDGDIPVDASGVRWESSKPHVAVTIGPGAGSWVEVRGVRPGQAVITGTYEDDCQTLSATATVTVCPQIGIEPSAVVISPGDNVLLEMIGRDGLGNTVRWDLSDTTWESLDPGVVWIPPETTGDSILAHASSVGSATIRATFDGECGLQAASAEVQVQADVLEGDWNVQAIWAEQACYVDGSLDSETVFTSDGPLTLTVEQSGPSITAQYEAYPESRPYRGTVDATLDPLRPYELELSIDSDATADCVELLRSGGTLYGQPVCSGCTVAECFESEQVSGYVAAGGEGFFGQSEWGLTALSAGGSSLFCEGRAALVGCREANPWALFVDTPCGSTEEAELLCTDFYGPEYAYADCVPSYGPYPGQLACVYCN